MARRRHWRHFSHREFNFDPAELVASIHDVIEAAMDAGLDSVYAFGGRDYKSWKADEFWTEARAFAGRMKEHPSWQNAWGRTTSAWERTARPWSDTD
jgi:hypothetical protein